MHDLKEPINMYDPYTYYPFAYSHLAYDEELNEIYEEIDPEELIDLEIYITYIIVKRGRYE